MWRGIKLGVIFLIVHSVLAVEEVEEEYYETNTFDLRNVIPGEPEVDYPIYSVAPRTSFTCVGRHEGYYADMETRCQVFRICSNTDFTGLGFPFLCPNGTIFNQKHFVCDWYKNVDCDDSGDFYYKNSEHGRESKDQMMRKARMMVEFPMMTLMKNQKHLTSAIPTTGLPTTRQPQTTRLSSAYPTTRLPPTTIKIVNTPVVRSTIETITKPSVVRLPNNPEHARQTNEVFISSLGELSSEPHTSFNPDSSVIINNDGPTGLLDFKAPDSRGSVIANNESPSRLLEAPRFVDLTSFASNINSLVDDVELEGDLQPNVVNVRSPKIPSASVKSKGFSMPRQTDEESLKSHASPSTLPPIINNEDQFESVEARKNAAKLLLSGVHLNTFDDLNDLNNLQDSQTETMKKVVSEAPLLINVVEEEESTTSTTTSPTTEAITFTSTSTTTSTTPSTTTSTTPITTSTPEPTTTKLTKPPRVALPKLKISPNRVSNYKYKYRKEGSSSTTEEPDNDDDDEQKTEEKTTTRKSSGVIFNRNFSRPTRPVYKRTSTTPSSTKSRSEAPSTTTTKSSYPYQRANLNRKNPLKSTKSNGKVTVKLSTTTTAEPISSSTESSSSTEPTTSSSSSTSTTSTTTEPTTTSKYFSFEKLKQSIFDDSILQNYRKTQEELAKLNPTVQPAYSISPSYSNYRPLVSNQAIEGRSQQSFYPQQNPYYSIPSSPVVIDQRPEISFHTQLQSNRPNIVIARSEEHSPFPLESRTARATPAPPSSGQYVPLKQYINQNFQSKSNHHPTTRKPATQKPFPNYRYTQPQNGIQYKPQPVQYKPQSVQPVQYKPQPAAPANKISTVQEKIPLFPPLVQVNTQPLPQQHKQQPKKQSFQTYQQFSFKTIPIAQRRFGLAEFDEDKKPNYSLFNGVSSYDVPLSSIGILRTTKQQGLQNSRVQG